MQGTLAVLRDAGQVASPGTTGKLDPEMEIAALAAADADAEVGNEPSTDAPAAKQAAPRVSTRRKVGKRNASTEPAVRRTKKKPYGKRGEKQGSIGGATTLQVHAPVADTVAGDFATDGGFVMEQQDDGAQAV